MEEKQSEPSIFLGCVAGGAIGALIGTIIVVGLTMNSGHPSAQGGLQMLFVTEGCGAYFGYLVTVRRRHRRNIRGPYDEWSKFFGSGLCLLIGLMVISSSFAIATGITIAYSAITAR